MNNRAVKLVVLLAALVIVGGLAFYAVNKSNTRVEPTETAPTAESFEIYHAEAADIVHVDWTFGGFIDESFTKKDGTWVNDNDPEAFFYQEEVDNWIARNLVSITSELKVDSTDLSSMGFDESDTMAHITLKDGTEYTFTFGNSTPTKNTAYFTLDGKTVYTVNRSLRAAFGLKLSNFQTTPSTEKE